MNRWPSEHCEINTCFETSNGFDNNTIAQFIGHNFVDKVEEVTMKSNGASKKSAIDTTKITTKASSNNSLLGLDWDSQVDNKYSKWYTLLQK